MKKALVVGLVFVGALAAYSPATAGSMTITDNYYGGETGYDNDCPAPYGVCGSNQDAIGGAPYDLTSMVVTIEDSEVKVKISGDYFQYIQADGTAQGAIKDDKTALGSLFISTDAWNPFGTAAEYYKNDIPSNGEHWEYALVLNTGGEAALYAVPGDNSGILYSGFTPNYRLGQEVLYSGTPTSALGGGSWLTGYDDNTDEHYLLLSFANDIIHLNIKDFALSWTMTCANDIIEGGSTPVPEPATLLLFGSGLAGLAGSALRRRKK